MITAELDINGITATIAWDQRVAKIVMLGSTITQTHISFTDAILIMQRVAGGLACMDG